MVVCVCVLPKKADTSSMMPNTHRSGAIVPVSLQHTTTFIKEKFIWFVKYKRRFW